MVVPLMVMTPMTSLNIATQLITCGIICISSYESYTRRPLRIQVLRFIFGSVSQRMDISWIPIGLMSAEDINQNTQKHTHSHDGSDGLEQTHGRNHHQHHQEGNKDQQNVLEVKLNMILDKFVSQQQQQQQQQQSVTNPTIRRRPLSKQSSFDDSADSTQQVTSLTLPTSTSIQGATHHKSKSNKIPLVEHQAVPEHRQPEAQ